MYPLRVMREILYIIMYSKTKNPRPVIRVNCCSENSISVPEQIMTRHLTDDERIKLQDMLLDDDFLSFGDMLQHITDFKKRKRSDTPFAYSQSDAVIESTVEDTSQEKEQNVDFMDQAEQIDLVVGRMSADPTFGQGMQENAMLGDFLSRPVEIARITWNVGAVTPFLNVINPWELFLSDPAVKNKIETFKLLHGTLKIKFTINGSPFHYGRTFVGVRPTKFDNNTRNEDMTTFRQSARYFDNATVDLKFVRSYNTLYSSRPHVFIDPQTNSPIHIDWPFFAGTNWIDLNDEDTVDRMGRLEIWELNQLRHANNATDPVTIAIFAWMEDVTLTGLTTSPPKTQSDMSKKQTKKKSKKSNTKTISNNSSKNNDEYNSGGAISAPAATVALAASYFTEIPYIGRFAKATSMAAGTVGDIARLFGFSRPAIISDPVLFRPQASSYLAHCVGGDSLIKLTLDPKQELTVDPATVGLPGDDQMSIGYIAKREAWIDSFPWDQLAQPDRILYSIVVHPMVAPVDDTSPLSTFHQSPLGFVTRPFTYWSGSLKYRFQVVASAFHRGRLMISYDPAGQTTVAPSFNSRYNCIIDISENRDFTIEVKWSQAQAYAITALSVEGLVRWTSSGQPAVLTPIVGTNGVLSVYVINELTSSITASTVDVNVFISAGDDYEVRVPDERLATIAYARQDFAVGPPATTQSDFVTSGENTPEQASLVTINGSYCGCDPTKNDVYFGDPCVSVRYLLKRYCYHRSLTRDGASSTAINSINYNQFNFPNGPGPAYGSSPASPLTPTATVDYNICAMTYMRYFSQAYIGWRGGIKWKVLLTTNINTYSSLHVARLSERFVNEGTSLVVVRAVPTTVTDSARAMLLASPIRETMGGGNFATTAVNPTMEYETPLYTPFRYVEVSEPSIVSTGVPNYQSHYNGGLHGINTVLNVNNGISGVVETYTSAGEDFSLFFFIGAPPVFETDVLTAS